MNHILKNINSNKKVLVLGDTVIDEYIYGECERMSSEFPIPVFNQTKKEYRLGGSGNVARNIKSFGLETYLLTMVGESSKKIIEDLVSENNIKLIPFHDQNYRTVIKTRYVSNGYQNFRTDTKAAFKMDDQLEQKIISHFLRISDKFKFVIISDYNEGLLTFSLTQKIIEICNNKNIFVLVDPKKDDYRKFKNASLIKPNRNDAEFFCNEKILSKIDIEKSCKKICETLNISYCIMTLSKDGMCVYEGDNIKYVKSKIKEVRDVVGAGDAVISSIVFGLINNLSIYDSCLIANYCAHDVISRIGTTSPNILNIITKDSTVINNITELKNLSYLMKKNNKKLVFTSGCFDLVHKGHIKNLEEAKKSGDYLFVALNSDESIKKIKGETRPVCCLESRLSILKSLKFIDFIMVFEEDTPVKIANLLDPDIIVKGEDYDEEKIKKIFPNCREFKKIKFVSDFSTTNIIEKIKSV